MQTKTCLHCGKSFAKSVVTPQNVWDNQTKFCSRACYWAAKKQNRQFVCPQCRKTFDRKFWNNPIYCSRTCASASQSKPLPKCEVCGKTCKRHSRRFCSSSCKKSWYRGENVCSYVGENFRKDAYPVDYSAWMRIAESIRERDKVCRRCGKTPKQNGRALDVHHIVPYRISFDNSPSNLAALCRSCHKKADHTANKTK